MMKQVRADTGIVHLRVPSATNLREFLLRADLEPLPISIDEKLIDEWLHYGSVYLEGKRLRENCELRPDQIVRLHTRRKTYVTQIPRLRGRIVFDHPDFLVLDKPSGLPTHATLDNYIENAAYLLTQELGYPVYVTHRLDVATSGLLIMAKSPKAQAAMNKQFAKRQVVKVYRARVSSPVAPGLVVHYMDPESRIPKIMSASPVPGWWECRMEVLSYENGLVTINLLTGKTHQIRAQLKALGAPIDGDAAYGSGRPARSGQIDLECHALGFRWMQEDFAIKKPAHE
jgi:23S rRNA pseudouridine1911/1915/1917 synthase